MNYRIINPGISARLRESVGSNSENGAHPTAPPFLEEFSDSFLRAWKHGTTKIGPGVPGTARAFSLLCIGYEYRQGEGKDAASFWRNCNSMHLCMLSYSSCH